MKMKIKRKLYLCQRKQSLSHRNGNCWRTLPVGGRIFFQKTKHTHSKAAIFCELLCVTQINLYKRISANQVPIQRSRRRGNTWFRGKTYAFELSSLDHTLPFSQGRKWKTKLTRKAKRAGVLLVELWIGWSVATIRICFLGPCMRLLKKRRVLP